MNIDSLRKYCLSFPGATEDVQWGNDLLFRIGGKIFAGTNLDSSPKRISFKCTPEEFAQLIELDGIVPADYVARYHWVTVGPESPLKKSELERLIRDSYEMILAKLPKKTRESFAGASRPKAGSVPSKPRRKGKQ